MDENAILLLLRQAILVVLLVSAPAVLVSLLVGLIVSVLQATTQLQDQTLSFVPKLIAVMMALVVAGGWMGAQLVQLTQAVLRGVPLVR